MFRATRRSAAFTLLELIVVIVILAVLAAIAVPTFAAVIDRSKDESAEATLSAYAREVQALAAFRGDGTITSADFAEAEGDLTELAMAPGVLAAGNVSLVDGGTKAKRATSTEPHYVSYQLADDARSAGVAAVSASGNCVAVRLTTTAVSVVEMAEDSSLCTGYNALTGAAVAGAEPSSTVQPLTAPDADNQASSTTSSSSFSWAPVAGAESYRVSVSVSSDMSGAESFTVTSLSYTRELSATEVFYATVSAVRGTEVSPPSSPVVRLRAVPVAPTNVVAAVSGSTATISWATSPGADGYYVYMDGSDAVAATAVGGSTTSVTVTLSEGQTASFVVHAVNAGGEGLGSALVSATAAPAASTLSILHGNGTDPELRWTAAANPVSYLLERSTSSTMSSPVTVYSGTALSSVDKVAAGQRVYYRVTVTDTAGTTHPSNVVEHYTSSATASGAPVATATSGSSLSLAWSPGSNVESYTIYQNGAVYVTGITGTSYATPQLGATAYSTWGVQAVNSTGASGVSTDPNPFWHGSTLASGAAVQPSTQNVRIYSPDARHFLAVQTDGNIVMYRSSDHAVITSWATGMNPTKLVMQTDGNLVVYRLSDGHVMYHAGTSGSGYTMRVTNAAKTEIVNSSGTVVWSR